jgi:hypothetical protein
MAGENKTEKMYALVCPKCFSVDFTGEEWENVYEEYRAYGIQIKIDEDGDPYIREDDEGSVLSSELVFTRHYKDGKLCGEWENWRDDEFLVEIIKDGDKIEIYPRGEYWDSLSEEEWEEAKKKIIKSLIKSL